MNELWKVIPGFEGLYEVSSLGRVRSCARTVFGLKKQTVDARDLKQSDNGRGYSKVCLWRDGHESSRYVHRLVLLAFVGEPPPHCEACHNDGIRSNNNLSNLRWDTHAANHADRKEHWKGRRGANARLSLAAAQYIRATQAGASDIAEAFGISPSTVHDIRGRRTWAQV